jgi:hypothetical protein
MTKDFRLSVFVATFRTYEPFFAGCSFGFGQSTRNPEFPDFFVRKQTPGSGRQVPQFQWAHLRTDKALDLVTYSSTHPPHLAFSSFVNPNVKERFFTIGVQDSDDSRFRRAVVKDYPVSEGVGG